MSTRYLSNLSLGLIAGTLVVFTQAFPVETVATLVFAFAIGLTVLSFASAVIPTTATQRVIGAVGTIIGAWTIVASLVFSSATVLWLGFAGALAILALAVIGLTVHELTTERVVHSLEVGQRSPAAGERVNDREPVLA